MSTFDRLSHDAKNELWACLSLRHAYGIGPRRAKRLIEHFGSALAAAEAGLARAAAWSESGIVPLASARKFAAGDWRGAAKLEWAAIRASGASFLLYGDAGYPPLLREIGDAPLLLYYKGELSLLRGPAVAVVGARRCTREGVAVSAFFSRALSKAGVTVISGMAKGIDRAAHIAGLDGPGRSVGVLGTGIDVAYPVDNADLFALLGEQGLLISEYAPGTGPSATHFPVRNRLISGLSRGVLVVEAAGRSGSLITARLGLEQNRDVFAVPGHTMAARSEGCRELIRRGAKAVFDADDILEDLGPLLTLEARAALEERRRQQEEAARNPAARARPGTVAAMQTQMLDDSTPVLPDGPLPWVVPAAPGLKAAVASKAPPAASSAAPGRRAAAAAAPLATAAAPLATVVVQARDLGPVERRVLGALGPEPRHIDEICRDLDMAVGALSGMLALLEVKGLARRLPGMLYALPEARHE